MYKYKLYDIITSFMAHMYTHNAQIYTYALSNVITVLSANIGNSQKKWARPHLIPERSLSIPSRIWRRNKQVKLTN